LLFAIFPGRQQQQLQVRVQKSSLRGNIIESNGKESHVEQKLLKKRLFSSHSGGDNPGFKQRNQWICRRIHFVGFSSRVSSGFVFKV